MSQSISPNIINESGRTRVFISYKRRADPDEPLAKQVFDALSQQHHVFLDQTMVVGTRWADRIEAELRAADFLIPFLSARSLHSEMVVAEIELAHRLAKDNAGRPSILPVRVSFDEPLRYPLSAYLDHIQCASWRGAGDTDRLIEQLTQAMRSGTLSQSKQPDLPKTVKPVDLPAPSPMAQPASLEMPQDANPESSFYVERLSDSIARSAIARQGETLVIQGSSKMGKSSLLFRTTKTATEAGKRVAFLDFHLMDKSALANGDIFFRQFCSWLTAELELEDRVDDYWKEPLGNTQRCTRYFSRYLLKELPGPLVLAVDEADSIIDSGLRSDFFGMLRAWHSSRRTSPIWQQLDLVLSISMEPYLLIDNLHQSPFIVGQVVQLEDFNASQIDELVKRHQLPVSEGDRFRLINLLGGHPYLTRQALYLLATKQMTVSELFERARDDYGPFGDHLRYQLFWLHGQEDLRNGLVQIIRNKTCHDPLVFFRLRSAGLVRADRQSVVPRCDLYAAYFRERLNA